MVFSHFGQSFRPTFGAERFDFQPSGWRRQPEVKIDLTSMVSRSIPVSLSIRVQVRKVRFQVRNRPYRKVHLGIEPMSPSISFEAFSLSVLSGWQDKETLKHFLDSWQDRTLSSHSIESFSQLVSQSVNPVILARQTPPIPSWQGRVLRYLSNIQVSIFSSWQDRESLRISWIVDKSESLPRYPRVFECIF